MAPALVALGQDLPTREVLTTFLHGYETSCRIGMAVGIAHSRIWHKTGTCGPFGSAMAAVHLLGLDLKQTVDALGNAGTESKHLHAGRAAEAGLIAAALSTLEFVGAPNILEGPKGLFAATCPDGNIEAILADMNAPWQVHATELKLWPCSWHTHPAIWSLLNIRKQLMDKGHNSKAYSRIEIETYQEGRHRHMRSGQHVDRTRRTALASILRCSNTSP